MAGQAYAACTSPAGQTGDQAFNGTQNVMAYCDGTNWISMAGGVSVTIGGTTNNPGGSTGQVQYNSGGAFAGSSAFTYSSGLLSVTNISTTGITSTNISTTNLTVNGVAITGSASGDRITSGTASAIANGGSGYISLTTGAITWGYLGSSATYLPNLNTTNVSASIVSVTALQIVSQSTTFTCNSGNAGTLRYNSPTTTLELCTGSGWQPMGVGIPAGTISAFASTTCPIGWSEYTPARGRFLRGIDNGAGLDPDGTRAPGSTQADAFQGHFHSFSPNSVGTPYPSGGLDSSGGAAAYQAPAVGAPISDGTNGTPRTSSETRPKNVAVTFCQFNGTSNGWNNPLSGGGGTATPAGSTADVQFNNAGALAADTGQFTYANGVLKVSTVSATNISASTGTFNGAVQFGGSGSETCSSAADYGKNRRNPVSGRMQVCLFR
jgi:hypothetical protein